MLNYENYIKQNILFIKSLSIKINDIVLSMNTGMVANNSMLHYNHVNRNNGDVDAFVGKDPKEWKYYRNKMGKNYPSASKLWDMAPLGEDIYTPYGELIKYIKPFVVETETGPVNMYRILITNDVGITTSYDGISVDVDGNIKIRPTGESTMLVSLPDDLYKIHLCGVSGGVSDGTPILDDLIPVGSIGFMSNANGETITDDNTIPIIFVTSINESNITPLTNMRYVDNTNIKYLDANREELSKMGAAYSDTIHNDYNEIDLINGVLFPVIQSLDKVLELKDGTIIGYNKTLLEVNETNVMAKLQEFTYGHLFRWYLREYVLTDDLYIHIVLGNLYSQLLHKLLNIRLGNIVSSKAHTFHIYSHLDSVMNIGEEIKHLSDSDRIWLYNNINYISNNIGKTSTLKMLIDRLTGDELEIGNVKLIDSGITTTDTLITVDDKNNVISDPNESSFVRKQPALVAEYTSGTDVLDLNDILISEYEDTDNTYNDDPIKTNNLREMVKRTINNLGTHEAPTKTLSLKSSGVSMRDSDKTSLIMDILWYDRNSKVETLINGVGFTNEALFYNILRSIVGPNKKIGPGGIETYTTSTGVNIANLRTLEKTNIGDASVINQADMFVDTVDNGAVRTIYTVMLDYYAESTSVIDKISRSVKMHQYIEYITTNSSNELMCAVLRYHSQLIFPTTPFALIDEGTSVLDLDVITAGYGYNDSTAFTTDSDVIKLETMIKALDANSYDVDLKDLLRTATVSILNKLTAYTTQVLESTLTDDTSIRPNYGTIGVLPKDIDIATIYALSGAIEQHAELYSEFIDDEGIPGKNGPIVSVCVNIGNIPSMAEHITGTNRVSWYNDTVIPNNNVLETQCKVTRTI